MNEMFVFAPHNCIVLLNGAMAGIIRPNIVDWARATGITTSWVSQSNIHHHEKKNGNRGQPMCSRILPWLRREVSNQLLTIGIFAAEDGHELL